MAEGWGRSSRQLKARVGGGSQSSQREGRGGDGESELGNRTTGSGSYIWGRWRRNWDRWSGGGSDLELGRIDGVEDE
jgi:hypothetical protein